MKKGNSLAAVLTALLLLLLPQTAMSKGWDKSDDVRNCVVRIVTEELNSGTGFFAGKAGSPVEYIITNAHVAGRDNGDGSYTKIYNTVTVVFDELGSDTTQDADVIKVWEDVDLALLRLKTPTTLRRALPFLSAKEIDDCEQDVHAVGFPGVSDDDSYFKSRPEDVTITAGSVTKNLITLEDDSFLQTDAVVNGGNSGGPLITEDGYIIGINTCSSTWAQTTNFSLYIDYAIDYLEQEEIPFERGFRSSSFDEQDSEWNSFGKSSGEGDDQISENSVTLPLIGKVDKRTLILIVGGTVLLVLAVIVAFAMTRNSRKARMVEDGRRTEETWRCVCGQINSETFCESCGRNRDEYLRSDADDTSRVSRTAHVPYFVYEERKSDAGGGLKINLNAASKPSPTASTYNASSGLKVNVKSGNHTSPRVSAEGPEASPLFKKGGDL